MRIIDRYMASCWIKPFLSALAVFLTLFLLIDMFGLTQELLQHRPPMVEVLRYILYRTGYAIFFLSPMALLIGGFWMTHGLRHNNEWTVSLLTGSSPLTVLRTPLILLALLTLLLIGINSLFMPEVSRQVEILDSYRLKNKTKPSPTFENIHTNLPDGRTIKIGTFQPDGSLIRNVTISKNSGPKITTRLDAPEGRYHPETGWVLQSVTIRRIQSTGEVETTRTDREFIPLAPPSVLETILAMDPRQNDINPVQFSIRDLLTSINYREKRDMNAATERILLHWKFGFPLTNFVMGLIGLVIGLRTHLNRAAGIGLCLILGLCYWVLFSLSISWGKVSGPSIAHLPYLPMVFVYGPPLIGLLVAYAIWDHLSEQA